MSETGSGTFVASGLPEDGMIARRTRLKANLPRSRAALSERGRLMIEGVRLLPASQSIGKAFRNYEPAIDLFPTNLWARIAGRVLRRTPRTLYAQGNAAGFGPLRRAVAEYLGTARGVKRDAGQVIITSGAQQALDLAARLLLEPGDPAWVEDPCYPGARFTLRAGGANIVPIPVDQEGLNLTAIRKPARPPKVIYTTPANQFPLGATLSLDRRLALLKTAIAAGSCQIYGQRMDVLKEDADRHLKGALDVVRAASGMRTIAWVKTAARDAELAERARAQGLELSALSQFAIRYPQASALILGFAGCGLNELRRGVNVLAGIVDGG